MPKNPAQIDSSVLHFSAMISRLLPFVLAMGMAAQASGQAIPRPDVPEKIAAPAGEEVVLQFHATGVQIYTCQAGADGKYAWTLKGPDADLHDAQGAVAGHHFAGPTWKLNDGSQVTAKASAKVDAPEAGAVAWLLLTVTGHSGDGALNRVTSIQRIHTKGGQPAEECSAAKQNAETKSNYEADYFFFAPPKTSGDLAPPSGAGSQSAVLKANFSLEP
jgi:hypothetical protein